MLFLQFFTFGTLWKLKFVTFFIIDSYRIIGHELVIQNNKIVKSQFGSVTRINFLKKLSQLIRRYFAIDFR